MRGLRWMFLGSTMTAKPESVSSNFPHLIQSDKVMLADCQERFLSHLIHCQIQHTAPVCLSTDATCFVVGHVIRICDWQSVHQHC